MKRTFVIAIGWLLVLTSPASARVLPSVTPEVVAAFDDVVADVETNGARTLLSGQFTRVGTEGAGGTIFGAFGGEIQQQVPGVRHVSTAIADGAGGWYTGGDYGVFHVLADGSVDPAFTVGVEPGTRISTLLLSPDRGTLYLDGSFATFNGQPRPGIAALDARTGALKPWNPGSVALGALAGGAVVVLGRTDVREVDAVTGATGRTLAVSNALQRAVVAGRTLYATEAWGLVAIDLDTFTLRWRASANETSGLAVTPDGTRAYVTSAARLGGPAVTEFDLATGTPTAFSTPLLNAGPITLSIDGQTAYVGNARAANWAPWGAIAFATRDGALLGWQPGGDNPSGFSVVARSDDGRSVFATGTPMHATRIRRGIALVDQTGFVTPWVEPARDAHTDIVSSTVDRAGQVYLARHYDWNNPWRDVIATAADGRPRWRVMLTGGAATVTLSPDERTLYLTGTFTAVDGVPRTGVAAVDAATGALQPWALTPTGGVVWGLRFSPDGRTVYVSGSFAGLNGVPRAGLAAVDVASGAVLAFNPTLDGRVGIVRVSPDGATLYVSGEFGEVDEPDHRFLVALRAADGVELRRFGVETHVRSFVVLADGESLIVSSRGLSAWDTATATALAWKPDACTRCDVSSLELSPDGQTLHVAGDTVWNGRYRSVVRLAVGRGATTPANAAPPAVMGTPAPGAFVECDPGTWTGHPTAFRYAWTLDGVPVTDFSGRELLLESADLGRAVRCTVTAGGVTATSPPVTVAGAATAVARRLAGPVTPTPTPTAAATATASPSAAPAATDPLATSEPVAPAAGGSSAPLGAPAPSTVAVDRTAPGVRLVRGPRLTLSERATVTTRLKRGKRLIERTFTLAAGRHTLTPRRLAGRAKLQRGRYTLTVRVNDAAGNTAPVRVLRFSV